MRPMIESGPSFTSQVDGFISEFEAVDKLEQSLAIQDAPAAAATGPLIEEVAGGGLAGGG